MERYAELMYVYILECSDDSYYIGIAADMEKRLKQHLGIIKGGAKYTTRLRKARRLAALWENRSGSYARKLEYRLKKKLDHAGKKRLCGDPSIPFSAFGVDIPQEEFEPVSTDELNRKFQLI